MCRKIKLDIKQGMSKPGIKDDLKMFPARSVQKYIRASLRMNVPDVTAAAECSIFSYFLKNRSYIVSLCQNIDPTGFYFISGSLMIDRVTVVPSISRGMLKANVKNMIAIDGSFTVRKGSILAAVMCDGNGEIQVLGYQLCMSESKKNWIEFITALRDAAGVTKETVIMADRVQGLADAILKVFNEIGLYFGCSHHLLGNGETWCSHMSKKDKAECMRLLKLLVKERSIEKGQILLEEMKVHFPEIYEKLVNQKMFWAAWQCGGRFGRTSSGDIESFNASILKDNGPYPAVRNMDPFKAVIALYMHLISTIDKRYKHIMGDYNMSTDRYQLLTRYGLNKVEKTMAELVELKYSVQEMTVIVGNEEFELDLKGRQCPCGYLNDLQLPCIHALALLEYYGKNNEENRFELCSPHYYVGTVLKTTKVDRRKLLSRSDIVIEFDTEGYVYTALLEGRRLPLVCGEEPTFIRLFVEKCRETVMDELEKYEIEEDKKEKEKLEKVIKEKVINLIKLQTVDLMSRNPQLRRMERRKPSKPERGRELAIRNSEMKEREAK